MWHYTNYPNQWGRAYNTYEKIMEVEIKLLHAMKLVPPKDLASIVNLNTIHLKHYSQHNYSLKKYRYCSSTNMRICI